MNAVKSHFLITIVVPTTCNHKLQRVLFTFELNRIQNPGGNV